MFDHQVTDGALLFSLGQLQDSRVQVSLSKLDDTVLDNHDFFQP